MDEQEEIEIVEELHSVELDDEIEQEKPKKPKSGKLVNFISNLVFIPVMIILVVYLVYAINIQKDNGIPSFFGQSYVRVMSGSMRKSGFQKGDVVVIQRVKIADLKKADAEEKNGSIIAFYGSSNKANTTATKNALLKEAPENLKDIKTGEETYKSTIFFHQIINIFYDPSGNTWFETKGTSNASPDSTLVRGDYVIGEYVDSGMAGVIQFISSTKGMIILIIVPCSILLFLLLLNIIEIVDQMMREKKEKSALGGDIKERELEVTTIIEENTEEEKKKTRKRRTKVEVEEDEDL